jgi:HAE1 family hydrophobic/amphiphilic exporter-1
MLFGTVFGVILIPGLYYVFAKMIEGKSLIRHEEFEPLTELYHYSSKEEDDDEDK